MEYTKPHLSFEQQADLLLERGLVADRDTLLQRLFDTGYYRLSGYTYPFRRDDVFLPGTTLDQVWETYVFDRQLRLVVFDAVERVEVFIRTQMAYLLAQAGGPFGYLDSASLPRLKGDRHADFLKKCRHAFERSREPFAVHFRDAYGDCHDLPPYWMLVNLMDFGMTLTLYKGAPVGIRQQVAGYLGVAPAVLESWLMTLNTVRNICAHHGRLWNRMLGTRPIIPRDDSDWHEPYEVDSRKIGAVVMILRYLLRRVAPSTHWPQRFEALLGEHPAIEQSRMGLGQGWMDSRVWRADSKAEPRYLP